MKQHISPLVPEGMEAEVKLHIEKIQKELDENSALLVAGNVNVFYSTGRFFRGYVWIPKEGNPLYFVIKPENFKEEKNVFFVRKPEQIPDIINSLNINPTQRIGLEEDILTYSDSLRLMKIFPEAGFFNGTPALRKARMVKTPYEIEQMRIDGLKHAAVYSKISSLYRPGMTDVLLQIEIEKELRLAGCLGYARVAGNLMEINLGSVLAGDNADNPSPYEFAMGGAGVDPSLPGGANGTPILKGQTVMIDMNGAFNAYQTDMTRVWCPGPPPEIAVKAQQCSIDILRKLEEFTVPGTKVCDMYLLALDMAEKAGLKEFFMGHSQQSKFIGHGVGIELNEQPPVTPRNTVEIQEGMTFALEPKFVIPGVGAAGVENTYVVGKKGLECLTNLEERIMNFN